MIFKNNKIFGDISVKIFTSIITFLCILIIPDCKSTTAVVQWGQKYQYQSEEIILMELGHNNFPFVPCKINNNKLKAFFDTGNFFGPRIAKKIIQRLELKPSGSERRSYDSNGTCRYSRKGYWVDTFEVFFKVFENIEMFEIPDNKYDACVGLESLLDGRFTIDYSNRYMGISKTPFHNTSGFQEFTLIWDELQKGMIVIQGEVNGIKTLIQIDTGKSRTTIDQNLIARANLKENNTLFLEGFKVDEIKIGTKSFSIECAKVTSFRGISKGYPQPILIGIGSDILAKIVLTVDYHANKVFIE